MHERTRARLRRETHPIHQELHRHPLLRQLLQHDVGLQDARDAAAVSYVVALRLETARATAGVWEKPSLSGYVADLRTALGPAVPCGCAADFPLGRHALLGGLYVMHGSALGAAVIAKHIRAHLGDGAALLFPARDTDVWGAVLCALDQIDAQGADDVEAGAMFVFKTYREVADAWRDGTDFVGSAQFPAMDGSAVCGIASG